MVFFKKGTIAAVFAMASVCFGSAAYAQAADASQASEQQEQTQQQYSEDDLKKFVEANTAVTEVQKESREAMVAAIEGENLTLDRFNELAKAHRAQKLEEVAENPEEIAAFSKAAQSVVKLQPETKEKVQQAIEEKGLTVEQYEQVMKAYKQDEAVQEQIRRIVAAQ